MKTEIKKILNMRHFFAVIQSKDKSVKFHLKQPSNILINNIHVNWLQYTHAKTHKQMVVYVDESFKKNKYLPTVFATIEENIQDYNENTALQLYFCDHAPVSKSELKLNIFVPQHIGMQYFSRWQRIRKYWWSSISTTPSLFTVNDLQYANKTGNADIVAQLPCGRQSVECLTLQAEDNGRTRLSCAMNLEDALFMLLLDGTNNSNEDYLRLHRKIAPYKVSFALDIDETSRYKELLNRLAYHLNHRLESKQISTWFPDFSLSFKSQMKENLSLGVTYTAVLNEQTLKTGIFNLVNSSTMLGEQVHVADFYKYAARVFEN